MKFLVGLVVFVVLFIVGATIYLQPNSLKDCEVSPSDQNSCYKADAIVVISGGDTAARTQTGIDLFKNGWADKIVLSGAALDKTGPSNAAAMKLQAEGAGIAAGSILIDEEATNTRQNAVNSGNLFRVNEIKDIILVTSGYHQRRASLEFGRLAETTVRSYPSEDDSGWGMFWWLNPSGWWLASSELIKILAFYFGVTS